MDKNGLKKSSGNMKKEKASLSDGKKTYTFEEYDEVVQERKQVDFFETYVFDVR